MTIISFILFQYSSLYGLIYFQLFDFDMKAFKVLDALILSKGVLQIYEFSYSFNSEAYSLLHLQHFTNKNFTRRSSFHLS